MDQSRVVWSHATFCRYNCTAGLTSHTLPTFYFVSPLSHECVPPRTALAMELVAAHTEEAAKARQESALNAAKFRRASRDIAGASAAVAAAAGASAAAPSSPSSRRTSASGGGRPPSSLGNRCVAIR